jgi:hypothetical protein
MNTSEPEDEWQDEVWTDSSGAIDIIINGPWDTTIRPRPPDIPPYSPRGKPPQQSSPPPTQGDDELPRGDSA